MAEQFQPFDLGRVIQTAEAIKGMRREDESDRLRNMYMGVQTDNARQAGQIAAAQEQRAATVFTQEQQVENTKLLNAAAAEVMTNPAAAERWLPQLQQAGIIDRGFDWRALPPEQLQGAAKQLHESTTAALQSLEVTQGQRFVANNAATAATTAFEREKELAGVQHGHRMEEINAQGKFAQERADRAGEHKAFKDSQSLRKEFEGMEAVKNFRAVQPIIQSARNAPDTGFGDLDMIYAVGKILDPNSVVREGELALTIAAGSPLQRIIGATRFSTENGGRLTAKSRQQLLQMLDGRVKALEEQFNNERARYSQYATENGWNPDSVVGRASQDAANGPKPGTVEDGYRFKGGDPADPKNWERAQ